MKQAICPFCGYQEEKYEEKKHTLKKSKLRNGFNRFWPKKEKHIWFLAVYEKT